MYRTFAVSSRRVVSNSQRGVVRVVKRHVAEDSTQHAASPTQRGGVIRKVFWATTGFVGTFYLGSTFLAFYNQTYYDFFSDHVPLGQPMLEFAESHGWDQLTLETVVDSSKNSFTSAQQFILDTIRRTPTTRDSSEPAIRPVDTKASAPPVPFTVAPVPVSIGTHEKRPKPVERAPAKESQKETSEEPERPAAVDTQKLQFSQDVLELVRKAEEALAGRSVSRELTTSATKTLTTALNAPSTISSSATEEVKLQKGPALKEDKRPVYEAPLPIGFEPPPGYARPVLVEGAKPQASGTGSDAPATLPLVSPAVSSLGASEPIIEHLARTIDNLVSFLDANPSVTSKVSDVLETAKNDLSALADRIVKTRDEERAGLEAKLDEQTREYTLKLMELEMEAQDKLDSQEDSFRKFFEGEKARFVQAYRAKLDYELQTQTELINERLREEVIAQGIELQRRWIREIKVRVEEERGGRLAKLDELASQLKRLERVALDNSSSLDENLQVHGLWSAIRAVSTSALSATVRQPFREELRVLRHIVSARDDPVIVATLESLENSQVPDIGVEPFADLASWFTTEVAPKVCHVALVPDEDAGVLSYLASRLFSGLRFRRYGLVEGDDVLSVVARAEYYLNEKDLDRATRELNQLKGPAKVLLHDWLEAARRRLEVQQALEVVQAEATLASLLVAQPINITQ